MIPPLPLTIHILESSRNKRYMILKLDIWKAYKRVDQVFLLKVLEHFFFCCILINRIGGMILGYKDLVLVNGSPQGFFDTSQGISQGDPISPFIFILLVECLGIIIARKRESVQWKGIGFTKGLDPTSHTQFASETCFFGIVTI